MAHHFGECSPSWPILSCAASATVQGDTAVREGARKNRTRASARDGLRNERPRTVINKCRTDLCVLACAAACTAATLAEKLGWGRGTTVLCSQRDLCQCLSARASRAPTPRRCELQAFLEQFSTLSVACTARSLDATRCRYHQCHPERRSLRTPPPAVQAMYSLSIAIVLYRLVVSKRGKSILTLHR